jgi:hypothetical protein
VSDIKQTNTKTPPEISGGVFIQIREAFNQYPRRYMQRSQRKVCQPNRRAQRRAERR